jgi:hypothetical protein
MAKKAGLTLESFNTRLAELGVDDTANLIIVDPDFNETRIESVEHNYDTGDVRIVLAKVSA